MKKAIIWGGGGTGKKIKSEVCKLYDVVCFVDSDPRKWGCSIEDIPIKNPYDAITEGEYDYVIVASLPGYDFIISKLAEYGVDEGRIISSYVLQPIKSRIQFLKDMSSIMNVGGIKGSCAEAGVFEGDFARYINMCFPEKKLYLFDTFEGFDDRDISQERELGVSEAKRGDYGITSIDMVMGKMIYPKKIEICKGYFPDSAINIDDMFCFVNLDMDLYLPTLNGLKWFADKIVMDGIILVHDYFSDIFMGPKKAVDEFVAENPSIKMFPIGDGISIMLTGFGVN